MILFMPTTAKRKLIQCECIIISLLRPRHLYRILSLARSPSLRNQHPMIGDNSFVYWTYREDYSNHHIVRLSLCPVTLARLVVVRR